MKYKPVLISLICIALLTGCQASYYKVPVTKAKRHWRPFNAKKDKGRRRVKTVKYKSLKQTKQHADHDQ